MKGQRNSYPLSKLLYVFAAIGAVAHLVITDRTAQKHYWQVFVAQSTEGIVFISHFIQ